LATFCIAGLFFAAANPEYPIPVGTPAREIAPVDCRYVHTARISYAARAILPLNLHAIGPQWDTMMPPD
jgi:hypothetical protein